MVVTKRGDEMKKLVLSFVCLFLVVPCLAETVTVELETNFGEIIIELYPDEETDHLHNTVFFDNRLS